MGKASAWIYQVVEKKPLKFEIPYKLAIYLLADTWSEQFSMTDEEFDALSELELIIGEELVQSIIGVRDRFYSRYPHVDPVVKMQNVIELHNTLFETPLKVIFDDPTPKLSPTTGELYYYILPPKIEVLNTNIKINKGSSSPFYTFI